MRSLFTWCFSLYQALSPYAHNAAELVIDLAQGVERWCQFLLDLPRDLQGAGKGESALERALIIDNDHRVNE